MKTEADLVERCLSGDVASMQAFVEKFQQSIFGLCFRMLGHRQDAEDIAQETFLRAFRSLHQWDSARPLMPWLLTIAANRCRTALQKRTRRPIAAGIEEYDLPETSERSNEKTVDLAEELQLALNEIKEDYRSCFILFYQQELSCAEIAEVLNVPVGTVKTWLHRARKDLAKFMERRDQSLNPNQSETSL